MNKLVRRREKILPMGSMALKIDGYREGTVCRLTAKETECATIRQLVGAETSSGEQKRCRI